MSKINQFFININLAFNKRLSFVNKVNIIASSLLVSVLLMWVFDKAGYEDTGFIYMILFTLNSLLLLYLVFIHNLRIDVEDLKSKNKDN